ncbi:MAG: amino acid permease [Verrucomicrobia bacterium]|nr:amino acid permease [Verrucomicrobiota bacterium]
MASTLPAFDADGAPVSRPRNVDWRRAAALLYGDWGTSKAYVIGMGFAAAQFSSLWIILAVCALTGVVGYMYSILCRLFPEGGGVYSAARLRSRALASLGALLLVADLTVTASLSGYFGVIYLGVPAAYAPVVAMAVILLIGFLNFYGPRHSGSAAVGLALPAVVAVVAILLLSVPHWTTANVERPHESFSHLWVHFVGVILALSGVEAIANMTGVMRLNPGATEAKPNVSKTANKALFVVAIEVVGATALLGFAMHALPKALGPEMATRNEDMLKYLAEYFGTQTIGPGFGHAFGTAVGIIYGLLLLSAVNTAAVALIGLLFLMGQDGEMPPATTKLNRHGVPIWPLVASVALPIGVLFFAKNGEALAGLYAIGVVGAIVVNLGACGFNRKLDMAGWERGAMIVVFLLLAAVWLTLAKTKPDALFFALCVICVGFGLRAYSHRLSGLETLTVPKEVARAVSPEAVAEMRRPPVEGGRILVAARGLTPVLRFAVEEAGFRKAMLYVVYIKEIALPIMGRLESAPGRKPRWQDDPNANAIMSFMLNLAEEKGLSVVPVYAVSDDPSTTIIDLAATSGADYVILGASQREAMAKLLRGNVVAQVASRLPDNIGLIIHG